MNKGELMVWSAEFARLRYQLSQQASYDKAIEGAARGATYLIQDMRDQYPVLREVLGKDWASFLAD